MNSFVHRADKNLLMLPELGEQAQRAGTVLMAALVLGLAAFSQNAPRVNQEKKAGGVSNHATGTFEVKLIPQKPDNKEAESAKLSRMSAAKQFHGDLEGTSTGEMLAVYTEVQGSAGYVAIERVTGTLKGRSGSFVLQHSGIMTRGAGQATITVLPDSGTGELTGLSGKMNIIIENGKHSYEFEYTLPEKPNAK
jgi:hypothetical protein